MSNDHCQSGRCRPGLYLLLRCRGIVVCAEGRPERDVSEGKMTAETINGLSILSWHDLIVIILCLDTIHFQKSSGRGELETILRSISAAA